MFKRFKNEASKVRSSSADSQSSNSRSAHHSQQKMPENLVGFQKFLKSKITNRDSDVNFYISDDVIPFDESKSSVSNYIDVSLVAKDAEAQNHTYHTYDTGLNKLNIHDVFKPNAKIEFTSQLLVEGNGGVGKSTLLKHLTKDWAGGNLWQNEIDFVFTLPLSVLNNPHWHDGQNPIGFVYKEVNKYPLESFIHSVWGNENIEVTDIRDILNNYKVSLLCDGFDEIARGYKGLTKRVIDKALQQDNFIITARPNSLPSSVMQKIPVTLENLGFTEEALVNYIEQNIDNSKELIELLENNTSLLDLCQTPLNASMICLMWQDTAMRDQLGNLSDDGFNLSGFYEKMINWLAKRFYLKNNPDEDGQNIPIESLNSIPELLFLQELAFRCLCQEDKKHIKPDIYKPLLAKYKVSLEDAAQKFGILKATKGGQKTIDLDHIFIHSAYQEFLASLFLERQLNNHETEKEFIMFIANNRPDMKYLNVFSHLAGLLSSDGNNPKVQQHFWEALTCNVDGVLELGSENQLILWLHALSEAKSGPLYKYIPNLEMLTDIIDLKVIQSLGSWSQKLINNSYFSDIIMKYLQEVASGKSPVNLESTIHSIKQKLSLNIGSHQPSDDYKTSSGEYESLWNDSGEFESGASVTDIINSFKLLAHSFHKIAEPKQKELVERLLQNIKDKDCYLQSPQLVEESINAIIKILDRTSYFNNRKEQLEEIARQVIELIQNENMQYYVADNIEMLQAKFNIEKDMLAAAARPVLLDEDSETKPAAAHIMRTLKINMSSELLTGTGSYNSPRKSSFRPEADSQSIPEKSIIEYKSVFSASYGEKKLAENMSSFSKSGPISRFAFMPQMPEELQQILSSMSYQKKGASKELKGYLKSLNIEQLLELQSIKKADFQQLYYKFMAKKLEKESTSVIEALHKKISDKEFEYISGLFGLVKQTRIDQFENSKTKIMTKLIDSVLNILEEISQNVQEDSSHNIQEGLLDWLNNNFQKLAKTSPIAKDYFRKILTMTLGDRIIDAKEAKFIRLCIEHLEMSFVTTEDGKVIFENRKYTIGSTDKHEKTLNDIAYAALEKLSKKGDVLSLQYLNYTPLFPNSGEVLPIATFDNGSITSLVSSEKIIGHTKWVISVMNYAQVTGDEPEYKNIALKDSFLLAEGRTAYGKYIAVKIDSKGEAATFTCNPRELNNVEFRQSIFGDMEYFDQESNSRKRYFVKSLDIKYSVLDRIIDFFNRDNEKSVDSMLSAPSIEPDGDMLGIIHECLQELGIATAMELNSWQTQYIILHKDFLIVADPNTKRDSNVIKNQEEIELLSNRLTEIEKYDLEALMLHMGQDPEALIEIEKIEASTLKKAFYYELRGNLNATFFACMAISTNMVNNAKMGVAGMVASILNKSGAHLPFLGIGLDVISIAFRAVDKQHWDKKIENFLEIAVDANEMARVTEILARKLTLLLDIKKIHYSTKWQSLINADTNITTLQQSQIDEAITAMRRVFDVAGPANEETIAASKAKIIATTICTSLFSGVCGIKNAREYIKAELIKGVVLASHQDDIMLGDEMLESKDVSSEMVYHLYDNINQSNSISAQELTDLEKHLLDNQDTKALLNSLQKQAKTGLWSVKFNFFAKITPQKMFDTKFIEKYFLQPVGKADIADLYNKDLLMAKIIMLKYIVKGAEESDNFKAVEKLVSAEQHLGLYVLENCLSVLANTIETLAAIKTLLEDKVRDSTIPVAEVEFSYLDDDGSYTTFGDYSTVNEDGSASC